MFTTYLLVIEKKVSSGVRLRKQTLFMPKGFYLYVGSAKRGLEKRIERHRRKRKKCFWHIDYITSKQDVTVCAALLSPRGECKTLKMVGSLGRLFGRELGSSDCECPSHFVAVRASSSASIIKHLLRLGCVQFLQA